MATEKQKLGDRDDIDKERYSDCIELGIIDEIEIDSDESVTLT